MNAKCKSVGLATTFTFGVHHFKFIISLPYYSDLKTNQILNRFNA